MTERGVKPLFLTGGKEENGDWGSPLWLPLFVGNKKGRAEIY